MISPSIQDYLKTIYDLTESGGTASTSDLATRLAVAPASVTGMIQKMAAANHPLVEYHKHQGTRLTREGRLAALEVIRHHRLLEAWLARSLGYPWDEVHAEAEVLEHVISEDFEKRISAALGDPVRDPHGDPIPRADLTMPEDTSVSLTALGPSERGRVCRVEAGNSDLLRHFESIGLVIGAKVRVLEIPIYDQVVHLRIQGQRRPLSMGAQLARLVFVEKFRSIRGKKRRNMHPSGATAASGRKSS